MAAANLSDLPGEVLLLILSYLEPAHITRLQQASKTFLNIGRDNTFWRARCFQESSFLETLDRRRRLEGGVFTRDLVRGWRLPLGDDAAAAPASSGGPTDRDAGLPADQRFRERERIRIMANWDPSYPSERVSWYDEYVQRNGPIATSWFQEPRADADAEADADGRQDSRLEHVEARGVALYRPDNPHGRSVDAGAVLAVSPLDDGGVCIWDVSGTRRRRGAVVSRSRPGILFIDGPGPDNSMRSKRVDSGVTECVSVDSHRHRASFAVQSHLIDIDLQTLSVVGCESFPWSITALSTAHPTVPLTVGTSLGIHLHDYRMRIGYQARTPDDRVDVNTEGAGRLGAKYFYDRRLRALFDDQDPLPPYAPLSQPGPLSIVHLQKAGSEVDLSDDIYVAGRFSNILHYDRRKFPSIRDSFHSGARLCSMASLPYPFSTLDLEVRRRGELSLEQIRASKSLPGGRTLVACGEYNTKGSLELYGFAQSPGTGAARQPGISIFKNRQTSSESKLLSVANHGTRIAVSDGSGYLKWFERDGFTEVRRCRIGHSELPGSADGPSSLFSPAPAPDDIARKLVPVRAEGADDRVGSSELLFWTGERLGLVGFSPRSKFASGDFDEDAGPVQDAEAEEAERIHRERMRLALERQADDVRFVRNLGLGSGRIIG